ncbi:MAG: SMC-Scp complex subunit ScpB [Candidatus Dormibacteraeota bacterium]|nr:SMC-Scp complex subunit ScpB [Candidatus Dormibacteraeota bacterium]
MSRVPPQLSAAIEAILFSSHRPLRLRELQQATETGRAELEAGLEALRDSLTDRGVMLQRHRDEVHLATRPEVATYVRRALRPEVAGRLSPAAYETLAIVAYQQPVTRSRIEEIRGVNSDGVLANLELRDLVVEVGRGSGPGQPKLYGTTMRFLQMLGLESLDQLPSPEEDGHLPAPQPENLLSGSGQEVGGGEGGAPGTALPGREPRGGTPPSGEDQEPSPSA